MKSATLAPCWSDTASLTVVAWIDPLVEAHGFGPMSQYVEQCWLGVLGPTTTWLYRRLATPLLETDEFTVDVVDLAVSLGVGEGLGRNSPICRSIGRLVSFGAAEFRGDRLYVRRALAPLPESRARHLSWSARQAHDYLTGGR